MSRNASKTQYQYPYILSIVNANPSIIIEEIESELENIRRFQDKLATESKLLRR